MKSLLHRCSRPFVHPLLGASVQGSFSLSVLFSSGAGILFVLLFYNLSSYLGATAALREASRLTARCITPSDPECVQLAAATTEEPQREWFGRVADPADEEVSVTLTEYEYSLALLTESWRIDFQTVEIPLFNQAFSLQSELLPLSEYTLNVLPPTQTEVTASLQGPPLFRPVASFPLATRDESLSPNEWLASRAPGYQPLQSLAQNQRIEAGSQLQVQFTFTVPPLPPSALDARASCLTPSGLPCDNAAPAGAESDTESWRTHAFLALKLFSQVQSLGTSSVVKWGRVPQGPGLYIDINSSEGNQRVCLGGREYSGAIGPTPQGHNLWLRGPAGAIGGTEAVCPEGDVSHDQLRVPRGSSVTVTAFLKVRSDSDPVQANIQLAYFYDEYQEESGASVQCQPQYYFLSPEQAPCQAPANCFSDTLAADDAVVSCEKREVPRTLGCQEAIASASSLPEYQLRVPECQNSDAERSLEELAKLLPTGYQACSLKAQAKNIGTIEVGSAPRSCRNARPQEKQVLCTELLRSSQIASANSCSALEEELEALRVSTSEANRFSPSSSNAFSATPQPLSSSVVPAGSEFAWLPLDSSGEALLAEDYRIQTQSVPLKQKTPTFLKRGEEPSAPPLHTLADELLKASELPRNAPGWSEYQANLGQYAQFSAVEGAKHFVTGGYPFEGPVPEIYYGAEDPSQGWDFNRDCQRDTACGNPQAHFASEEAMLRSFAARYIPEAGDTEYPVVTESRARNVLHLGRMSREQAGKLSLPSCTPTRTLCEFAPSVDAEFVSLGVSSGEPQACQDGRYVDCYGRVKALDIKPSEQDTLIDIELAKQKGFAEIQRVIPFARLKSECESEESACASIRVEAEGEKRSRITTSFNLPLSFPFDIILGKKVLPLSHSKVEVNERNIVGFRSRLAEN